MISLNGSPRPRPDVPARFESLNDDTLTTMLQFVGRRSYRSFGGINKRCKEVYITSGMVKETFLYGYAPLSRIRSKIDRGVVLMDWYLLQSVGKGVLFYNRLDVLEWAIQEQNKNLLEKICFDAVEEERFDLLNKVWNNIGDEEDKRDVFLGVDEYAALYGKLNVIKWIENKGIDINKKYCAMKAAEGGHLHILQWLREEKDLELDEELYDFAACGHLHVMKWLRDHEVPWSERTFENAAYKGNLDILQWLHDEGCPWPEDDYFVYESEWLKPEVVDWLRSNGYGDRIIVDMEIEL